MGEEPCWQVPESGNAELSYNAGLGGWAWLERTTAGHIQERPPSDVSGHGLT